MDWLAAVLDALESSGAPGGPVALAIDGPDCAGKTTLADAVAESLGSRASRICADDFLNPADVRYARGELDPEGCYLDSFDNSAMATAVNDWRRAAGRQDGDVLVADGVFLLRPELRSLWDVRVYLDVPPSVTLERARVRDAERYGGEERVRERYLRRYLPAQELYRRESDPIGSADLNLRRPS